MRVSLLLMWIALVAFVEPALAQTAPAPAAQQQRRDKIKQRIRALRAYTLTEQLDLDEATAAKLFPALAKYDDEFDKLLQARADVQRKLDGAGSIKDPKAVDRLIDEAVANQRAVWDTEAKRLEQLRKILSPAQVARVLIVLPAMERRIQNQLRKATQNNARGPGAAQEQDLKNPFDDERFDKHRDATASPGSAGARSTPGGSAQSVDPFDAPSPPKKRPAKPAPPCDPFESVHGCTK